MQLSVNTFHLSTTFIIQSMAENVLKLTRSLPTFRPLRVMAISVPASFEPVAPLKC